MKEIKLVVILLMLGLNLLSQEKPKTNYQFKLSTLSEKIIDMFINDPMNKGRIDTLTCSIIFSFNDIQDLNNELWIYDANLLNSCLNKNFVTKYNGYNIFIDDSELLPKYISKRISALKTKCKDCENILSTYPKGEQPILEIYDGSTFKVKKGTTIKDIKIEKEQGG